MPLSFPLNIVPSAISDPVPVLPNGTHISPLTQSSQRNGSSQHLYECEFQFPPLTVDQYRTVKALAHKFGQDDVVIPYYEPWIKNTLTGGFKVASGSSGFALKVKDVGISQTLKAGQSISISTGGNWYFYTLAADSAAGSATRTLTLTGAIRTPHADGDNISISPAYIQGYGVLGVPSGDNNGVYSGLKITIREAR